MSGVKEYFEDCQVGDRVSTSGRTITEADAVMFAAFSGDWNPLHTDEAYARTTPFGQRLVHGMLGLVAGSCLLSRVGWVTFCPRSTLAITTLDQTRFLAPIHIGDTLYLEAEIAQMRAMSSERGTIVTSLCIKNQRGEAVIVSRIGLVCGRRTADG